MPVDELTLRLDFSDGACDLNPDDDGCAFALAGLVLEARAATSARALLGR